MKTIISIVMLTIMMFASAGFAEPFATSEESYIIQPLHRHCGEAPQPNSVAPYGKYCDSKGVQCPPAYKPVPRWCHGRSGWYRCGTACEFDNHYGGA
ncbi:hypothetical protein QJS83_15575 [Bdellovibrio sp. 22V]|uniref:hypothetical protein n=1 Tax=Bdellovibrio TaxID=958 RepID=UPI00254365B3|nr:hypothetical protein [Bdellovibrio sp. 22V]WII71883.1 hypothetical protein QJS83_15575 [Bdellovibrio sp. 22V]